MKELQALISEIINIINQRLDQAQKDGVIIDEQRKLIQAEVLIIAMRGGYEIINMIDQRLDQAQKDGVITDEQRKLIQAEAQRIDSTIDSLVELIQETIGSMS